MTTSDQQGQGPLTRKQLREIRLTGSTPVITDDEAAASAAPTREPDAVIEKPAAAKPVVAKPVVEKPVVEKPVVEKPVVEKPVAAKPVEKKPAAEKPAPAPATPAPATPAATTSAPAPAAEASVPAASGAPLTRRQARDQERVRTASVPVVEPVAPVEPAAPAAPHIESPGESAPIVSAVPEFSAPADPTDDVIVADDLADDDDDAEVAIAPVSAAGASASVGDVPLEASAEETQDDLDDVDAVLGLDQEAAVSDADDVLADVGDDDEVIAPDERPTVNPAFGASVIDEAHKPFAPSFDELLTVGDSSGSQHTSPSALIFTPSPGEGSLSGPVASTGEILVTGSYELPRGIGSQGHAHGVADGKDVDAVLIDGELPPASSPTPIAASSAVSTIKPAGEVIRPPAPEKGNKLMLILAIVAGGLALALGVVLVVAFTTNVF